MKIEEIVSEIATKEGITPAQAQASFMASLEYIKTKLPDSIGAQLTGLLEGKTFDFNVVLKEKLGYVRDEAEEKLEEWGKEAKETFEEMKVKGKDLLDKMF